VDGIGGPIDSNANLREDEHSFKHIWVRECVSQVWGCFADFDARADPTITDFSDVSCLACIGGDRTIQFETTSSATNSIDPETKELDEVKGWNGRRIEWIGEQRETETQSGRARVQWWY
jgi:hypothetical protein